MFLEAARNLFVPELVRVLDEKLVLECVRSREYPLPPVVPTTSLEPHVSISWLYHSTLNECSGSVLWSTIDRYPDWTLISSRDKGLMALSLERPKAVPLELHF